MKRQSLRPARRMSLCLVTLLFACAVCLYPPTARAEGNSAVQEARNGVVRIFCLKDVTQSQYSYSTGSGFAVGTEGQPVQFFVTNNHVVEGNPEQVYVILDQFNGLNSLSQDGIRAQVVWRSESPDLALLQIAEPTSERVPLPLQSAQSVQITQPIYALGFPGVSDDMNDEGKKLPSKPSDVTATTGTVTKEKQEYQGMTCIQMDAVINHGNSGGPLLTEEGNIVGVNTFGALNDDKTQADGTNYAIYIDYIMNLLDQNDIPYRTVGTPGAQAPDSKPSGSSSPAASGSPAPAGKTNPSAPNGKNSPSSSGSAAYKAGQVFGAILLIGGVVLVVVLLAKRKNRSSARRAVPPPTPSVPPSPPAPTPSPAPAPVPVEPPSPPPAPSSNAPRLVCSGGVLSGTIAELTGRISIGRDPARCNLIYPKGAPGISSLHCEVRNDEGSFTITDLGSTYGTYLESGVKLSPHQPYPIGRGARFFLGNEQNSFTVS